MNRDIAYFVSECQQVKVKHQKPRGMNQEVDITTWNWEVINIYFITGLPQTRKHMTPSW